MNIGKLDQNATRAFSMMLSNSDQVSYFIIDLDILGAMYVMWQNRKTLTELSQDKNIPNYEKEDKLRKINHFKKVVLGNLYTDTTIFGMRKDDNSPIVISDGIHRAIGIQRAFMENPTIKEKMTLKILLFEGNGLGKLEDYYKSI
ncbi:MAG: hypothetical protein HYV37_03040 [Candidatus Levyibacteriota bacterium]|nr:MAG: hypothetical protein HYV37_03040 [Candidatus Levybacteria bacterium]